MKKLIAILCIFVLCLSLTACSKVRDFSCYSVQQHGDGWSIVYTDEEGVEEIAALGSYEQPLAFEKGRFYFVQNGSMVSVDPDGKARQETVITGLPENAKISFVDEENFYCLADRGGATCWRISKTVPTDQEEMVIPREFRAQYYRELKVAVYGAVSALEDKIRVRSVRAEMDSNGSLLSVDLELLCYDHDKGFGMEGWRTCRVEAAITLDGVKTTYTNENLILSVAYSTVSPMLTLEDCITILEDVDTSLIATTNAQGEAAGFRLVYQADEYEAYVDDNYSTLPYVDQNGQPMDVSTYAKHFVLAQIGGCDTALTDSDGTACGNLTVIRFN